MVSISEKIIDYTRECWRFTRYRPLWWHLTHQSPQDNDKMHHQEDKLDSMWRSFRVSYFNFEVIPSNPTLCRSHVELRSLYFLRSALKITFFLRKHVFLDFDATLERNSCFRRSGSPIWANFFDFDAISKNSMSQESISKSSKSQEPTLKSDKSQTLSRKHRFRRALSRKNRFRRSEGRNGEKPRKRPQKKRRPPKHQRTNVLV